ncbi:DNA replication licensing factor mcm10 [Teratosphaeria destructans]|uniref:DNA replication licensing factor mcm10 n=1 Tax=Teratosphaeria destructans TaxID=418781 RepID=A0A9W7SWC1_9PEZI|nr:DNA replication licensing factor mcm10 [Teratosphaeria destructans]
MVVVRESPRAKISPDKNGGHWPPKSPFQALLSSPSGRKKWEDRTTTRAGVERSPSPSPLRRPQRSSKALQELAMSASEASEDEEDIQLRLEEIRLRQKQKKLEKKRKLETNGRSVPTGGSERSRSPVKSDRLVLEHRRPNPNVEVPLSPTRDRILEPQEQLSPARRRLGLDAVTKATDVSLKRARDGTQIKRTASARSATNDERPKMSFNDRLKASRQTADDREAKQDRIERSRSKGFGKVATAFNAAKRSMDETRSALRRTDSESQRPSSAREMQTTSKLSQARLAPKSSSERISHSDKQPRPRASGLFKQEQAGAKRDEADSGSDLDIQPPQNSSSENVTGSFESFSETHLSKRNIAHSVVARELEGKEVYTLPRLLKEVKAPHYDPPDCEEDFVVFAILASKSSPFDAKSTHKTSDMDKPQQDAEAPRNKFLVLHLTDLKWEIDLFLFGTGFDQFWKLTPGTLLCILNPAIMPPKTNQHNGRFSLKLSSSEDMVMEVGVARDLGYCTSIKKDGQQCGQWVDKRHTEVCEFHLNLFVEKQRKGRMEVNTMWRGSATGNEDARIRSRARQQGGFDRATKAQKGITNHREYGTLYSVATGMGFGKTAATLLDAEDVNKLDSFTEGEKSRKRIAAAEKDRQLQRRLGQMGSGVGAEYMQAKSASTSAATTSAAAARGHDRHTASEGGQTAAGAGMFDKPRAADLGLLNNKATDVHMSPARDRKSHFGLGASHRPAGGREALGWGGAKKPHLLLPRESGRVGSPERGQTKLSGVRSGSRGREGRSLSPSKRARFMLVGKGIREPGRESDVGLARGGEDAEEEDDDDDLDIV